MIFKIVSVATLVSLLVGGAASILAATFSVPVTARMSVFLAVTIVADASLLYGAFERRAFVFGRIFWKAPGNPRVLSVTFDDGPNEPHTSQILDILKSFDVKATFFVLGKNAEAFPDTLKRIIAEGHEIGNHTYDHEVLVLKSASQISDQIARTNGIIARIAGVRPRLFRSPHGWRNPWSNRVVMREHSVPVAWTLGVWDTDRPGAERIVERTLRGLKGGCVLLLHDGRGTERGADASQLVSALPRIITEARRAGYSFVRLSDMMEKAGTCFPQIPEGAGRGRE